MRRYKKLSWKYVNTAEIITKAYDDPFCKKTRIKISILLVEYQNFLANLFSQCKVSLCERNTHDASSVGENCCSISAQKTTKKIFLKICWEMKTPTRTWKLVHALHYANELLLRVRLAFQKLLQTRQTSRNYQKIGLGHDWALFGKLTN